jgi:hypothetical protein
VGGARRRSVGREMGIWLLKGIWMSTEQETCPIYRKKKEDLNLVFRRQEAKIFKNDILHKKVSDMTETLHMNLENSRVQGKRVTGECRNII